MMCSTEADQHIGGAAAVEADLFCAHMMQVIIIDDDDDR